MSYIKVVLGPLKKDKEGNEIPGSNERGLKFNQLALELMTGLYGETSSQSIYAMFYGGLRGNSFVKREEPDYTFEDVCDWVDQLYAEKKTDVINEVAKVMSETQLYKSLVPEVKEEKKRLRKAS